MHSIHNSIITVCPVRSYHLWAYCTNMSVCKTMPDSTWEKNVHFSWIIYQRSLLQEQSCEKYTPEKTLNKCRYVCLIKRKKKKKKKNLKKIKVLSPNKNILTFLILGPNLHVLLLKWRFGVVPGGNSRNTTAWTQFFGANLTIKIKSTKSACFYHSPAEFKRFAFLCGFSRLLIAREALHSSHSPIHKLIAEAAEQVANLLIRSRFKGSWGIEPAIFQLLDDPLYLTHLDNIRESVPADMDLFVAE